MKTTIEFIDGVKSARGVVSDYAVAPIIGVTRSQISRLRNGKDFFGDSTAIRVAELLEIDPSFVLACVHAERAKGAQEKAAWAALVEKLGGLAASVVLGFALVGTPAPAQASSAGQFVLCQVPSRHNKRHKSIKFCPV